MYQAPARVAAAITAVSSAAVRIGVQVSRPACVIAEVSVVTFASWWPVNNLTRQDHWQPSYRHHANLSRCGTITSVRVDHGPAPAIVPPASLSRPRDNANAPVAELVDALDSKSSSARSAGSIPARGTIRAFALIRSSLKIKGEVAACRPLPYAPICWYRLILYRPSPTLNSGRTGRIARANIFEADAKELMM